MRIEKISGDEYINFSTGVMEEELLNRLIERIQKNDGKFDKSLYKAECGSFDQNG
eukprot:CAMPEP_0116929666 /NCGR_PEP_ID=MMETSP0467-20121206/26712_1 /TAXON_ID=283647 /ORGANISM="Mesodinium pulex, Strain SPMC105" /LENGTH=54 /DNA_ID=CAMNT_0004609669 /DNA_START=448 /DNA_END=612 /DNA_ORIENTATION=+